MPNIDSPLSGKVISILVTAGDAVTPGAALLLVESMKMEIPVEAESTGVVSQVLVAVGDEVREGQALVTLG